MPFFFFLFNAIKKKSNIQLLTVGLHEFSHAAIGCCTGAKIESIEIDPDEGGATKMVVMIFFFFDIFASKIVLVVLGVMLIIVLFWAKNWLTRLLTVFFVLVIIGLWFTPKSAGLKYFVLFVG